MYCCFCFRSVDCHRSDVHRRKTWWDVSSSCLPVQRESIDGEGRSSVSAENWSLESAKVCMFVSGDVDCCMCVVQLPT